MTVRRRSVQGNPRPLSYKSSSSDHSDNEINDKNLLKILAECRANLDRTEALKRANPQLLRPEDYVSFKKSFLHSDESHSENVVMKNEKIINKNVRCGHVEETKISKIKTKSRHKSLVTQFDVQEMNSMNQKTPAGMHNGLTKNSRRSHDVKGFFHYVFFVTIYVILLFILTLLITQKITVQ